MPSGFTLEAYAIFYVYGIFERTSEHENSTCLLIYLIPKCYAVFLCGKEKEKCGL